MLTYPKIQKEMLEYVTYLGAAIISLIFWLSFDMVSEASVTRGHRFESQPPLIQSGKFIANVHPQF